jgi:hypothetical protein
LGTVRRSASAHVRPGSADGGGYALFQPIKGAGPENYIIEDGKGEPGAWILEEWRQSMSLLVSVARLEHE